MFFWLIIEEPTLVGICVSKYVLRKMQITILCTFFLLRGYGWVIILNFIASNLPGQFSLFWLGAFFCLLGFIILLVYCGLIGTLLNCILWTCLVSRPIHDFWSILYCYFWLWSLLVYFVRLLFCLLRFWRWNYIFINRNFLTHLVKTCHAWQSLHLSLRRCRGAHLCIKIIINRPLTFVIEIVRHGLVNLLLDGSFWASRRFFGWNLWVFLSILNYWRILIFLIN